MSSSKIVELSERKGEADRDYLIWNENGYFFIAFFLSVDHYVLSGVVVSSFLHTKEKRRRDEHEHCSRQVQKKLFSALSKKKKSIMLFPASELYLFYCQFSFDEISNVLCMYMHNYTISSFRCDCKIASLTWKVKLFHLTENIQLFDFIYMFLSLLPSGQNGLDSLVGITCKFG